MTAATTRRHAIRLVLLLVTAAARPELALVPPASAAEPPAAQPTAGGGNVEDPHQIAPGLTLGGSIRLRYENKRGFLFNDANPSDDDSYLLSQFRMNLTWKPAGRVSAFLELQDAEIQGSRAINEDATPNIFADSLDIHQAYVDVRLGGEEEGALPVLLRVGRLKLLYGTQRLVGPLEWVNTARVWDGALLRLGEESHRQLDVFLTRLVPVDPNNANDHARTGNRLFDSDFHGAYYSDRKLIPNTQFEAYALLRRNDFADDDVRTLGVRFVFRRGAWDAEADTAWQTGDYGGMDQRAGMVHLAAGYTAAAAGASRFGVAWNLGTGDGDPADRRHGTFDNLYPTNHAHYGYMDFFSLQNLRNLELSWDMKLGRTALRAAWQDFRLDEPETDAWYNAGAGVFHPAAGAGSGVSSHAGSELDLTLQTSFWNKRLGMLVGYSRYFAGDYLDDVGLPGDSANFAYIQTALKF